MQDKQLQELIDKIKTYAPNGDIDLVKKAYYYGKKAHDGQLRKSGEPYFIHPIAVANILCDMELDMQTIAAGLLHDVVEDTQYTYEDIKNEFGEEVADLVDGVTKLGQIKYKSKEETQAENLRKMFLAMSKDIRVILIKLADRLHNMRTLKFMPPEKAKSKAKETLEIYGGIASRLGIYKVKWELEDIALRYIDSEGYYDLVDKVAKKRSQREAYIERIVHILNDKFKEVNIKCDIYGRPKHFYSIYRKMKNKHKDFEEIYDLMAVRIIVDSVKDCYAVLGMVHTLWKPIPGRFKDYIAMPKPNMYQSLHTAVIGESGHIYEIQIRTEEMDELAERGVASHWRYKENREYSSRQEQKDIVDKLQWLGDFITLSDEIKDGDAKEYYDSLRHDIFDANVYVMTPQGKIVELPNGATPIDFAYRIHTEVGHHAVGAIVNNVMVPINTKLKTGDVCEIKTNKNSGPSEDWLKFVQTAGAKNKIRQYISKKNAETHKEAIEEGKRLLKEEIKKRGLDEKKYLDAETYKSYFGSFGASCFDDLLLVIGRKQATANTLLDKVVPNHNGFFDNLSKILKKNNAAIKNQKKTSGQSLGISVSGVDGLKVQLSKCCNPIPGDDIVGYVSKGQGIKVHRADCPNLKNIEKSRLIDVYWDYTHITNRRFEVDIEILGLDRPNLLNDIITVLGQTKVNILNINAGIQDMDASISLKLSVENAEVLQVTIDNLNKIHGVYEIKRVIH